MMNIKVILLAILVAGISACQSPTFTGEKPESPGVEGKQFSDIPAPPRMAMDTFCSYGHSYTKFDNYTIVYRGDYKETYIADFFRKNMSRFGWQMESDTGRVLTFAKGAERCVVTISSEGVGRDVATIERSLR